MPFVSRLNSIAAPWLRAHAVRLPLRDCAQLTECLVEVLHIRTPVKEAANGCAGSNWVADEATNDRIACT